VYKSIVSSRKFMMTDRLSSDHYEDGVYEQQHVNSMVTPGCPMACICCDSNRIALTGAHCSTT